MEYINPRFLISKQNSLSKSLFRFSNHHPRRGIPTKMELEASELPRGREGATVNRCLVKRFGAPWVPR